MPDPSANSSLTLSDLARSIAHHWRAFIVVVLVSVALGVAAGILMPDEYAASASLTVEPVDVAGTDTSVNMDTERVIAASMSVVLAASSEVPELTPGALSRALAVSVPKGSQVLDFTVTLADPELAAEAANAVAEAYNAARIDSAEREVDDARTTLTDRVTALESTKAVEGPNSQAGKAASVQIEALELNIATLNAATFSEGTLVSAAIPPRSSTKPSLLVFAIGALVFGALVGSFVALGRARQSEVRLVSLGEERTGRRGSHKSARGSGSGHAMASGPPPEISSMEQGPSTARDEPASSAGTVSAETVSAGTATAEKATERKKQSSPRPARAVPARAVPARAVPDPAAPNPAVSSAEAR